MVKEIKKESGTVKAKTKALDIIIPEEVNTVYSNYAHFSISDKDVVVDFGQQTPDSPSLVKIHTRVFMSHEQTENFIKTFNSVFNKSKKS